MPRVCRLVVVQAHADRATEFRVEAGRVDFLVEGVWHEVMNIPEHFRSPVLEWFREASQRGPEGSGGRLAFDLDVSERLVVDIEFDGEEGLSARFVRTD